MGTLLVMKSYLVPLLGLLLCSSPLTALSGGAVSNTDSPDELSYRADFQLKMVLVGSQDSFQQALPRGSAEYLSDPHSGVATLAIEVRGLSPGTYQFIGTGSSEGFGVLTGHLRLKHHPMFAIDSSSDGSRQRLRPEYSLSGW